MTQPHGDDAVPAETSEPVAEPEPSTEPAPEAEVGPDDDDVGTGTDIGGFAVTPRSAEIVLADVAAFTRFPPGAFAASDSGNARRFVYLYGNIVRYAADSKMWYVWSGSRWRPDIGDLTVLGLTLGVANYMRNVEREIMPDQAEALGRFALLTESEGSRRRMLKLAAAEPGIKIREADLDADPMLLVTRNGTLDLTTRTLRENRPGDLCTRQTAVSYDPEATCPMWESHVKLVTDGDPLLEAYLRRACGYALTGLIGEQKFWFLWGDGQNGKNVFVETIVGLLGEYGSTAPPGLLTGGTSQHPTILADLRGSRMVVVDETGHERINDARVKMLTGSTKVKARFIGKDFFEYDSTMKLWVLGNTKPTIKDQTDGTWRRMQLVPFTVKIPDSVKRIGFVDELRSEWAGILNWCLAGLQDWQTLEGMGTPAAVADAVQAYREEEDEIGQWLSDCCTVCDDGGYTTTTELYASYAMWCVMNGVKRENIMTNTSLGRAMTGKVFGNRKIGPSAVVAVDGKKLRVRHGIILAKLPKNA